jgi:methylthioribulose-1-phosphate dehydratase
VRSERRFKFDASGQCPLTLLEQIQLSTLCEIAKRLDSRFAIPATSSNFSIRSSGRGFLVSRSGKHKRNLNPSDFLLVDMNGDAVAPVAPKASDETLLHALIYRHCPSINVILHCHAPELEKVSPPEVKLQGHELLKALGLPDHKTAFEIAVYPNSQDMTALAKKIEQKQFTLEIEQNKPVLFVLAQHGIYCGWNTLGRTEAALEAVLHLLKHSNWKSA